MYKVEQPFNTLHTNQVHFRQGYSFAGLVQGSSLLFLQCRGFALALVLKTVTWKIAL
jgi:hypothetical protein